MVKENETTETIDQDDAAFAMLVQVLYPSLHRYVFKENETTEIPGQDDAAFTTLFHEFYPSLWRFLECLLGGSKELAHDLAQESFLKLYRTAWGTLSQDEARFWLYRVARDFAMKEFRKSSKRNRLFDRVAEALRPAARNPAEEIERKELILQMLSTLPEKQRVALLLREQEQLSFPEIAQVLNVSEHHVKVDIFRARHTLREQWESDVQSSGAVDKTTPEALISVRNLIQEETVAGDYVAMRYRTLIDRKYLQGLSSSEENELEGLKATLDKMDEPYYSSIIKRLERLLENRTEHTSQVENRHPDASLL